VQWTDRLVRAGMTPVEATRKEPLWDSVTRALAGAPGKPVFAWFVPGRIEVLGKHTDYAGGRSLLCAVERGFCIAAVPREDRIISIRDVLTGQAAVWKYESGPQPSPGHWSTYPAAVADRIAKNFPEARRGADIAFASDLPPAAGLGSSSAFMIGAFLALAEVNGLTRNETYRREIRSDQELAAYLAAVENGRSFGALAGDRGVGTLGGSEDHTAIVCSRAGFLGQYSFAPVRLESLVPYPRDYTFVVGTSSVSAEKTGSALESYNRASMEAQNILECWRRASGRHDPSLAAAVAADPGASGRIREAIRSCAGDTGEADRLLRRFEQFHQESFVIVPRVAEMIAAGEIDRIGTLVDQSQELAERCLANQVPETIALARIARQLGALAASSFGAGFGGSVWALVPASEAPGFRKCWSEAYRAACPARAAAALFFETRPGPAALQFR